MKPQKSVSTKEIQLKVRPTEARPEYSITHIIQVNSKNMRRLGIKKGDYVEIINAQIIEFRIRGQIKKKQLSIIGRVGPPDDTLADDEVRVDQTLRVAIGLPPLPILEEGIRRGNIWKVIIKKIKKKNFLSELLNKFLPAQEQVVRIHPVDVPHAEKGVCLIDRATMKLIGVSEGDFVILERGSKSILLRALELTEELLKERKELISKMPDRYPPCLKFLKLPPPDIPWIFIDKHARDALNADICDPVIIRRSTRHVIYKNLISIALALLITLIGISLRMPGIIGAIILCIGLVLSILLILIKMRMEFLPKIFSRSL